MLWFPLIAVMLHGCVTQQAGQVELNGFATMTAGPVVRSQDLVERDGRKTLSGVPFTGTVLERYPDGSRKTRYNLVEGRAQGAWAEWHPDGAIRFYSEWDDGKGDGPFVYFHPNGEISSRGTARTNIWVGVTEGWHPNGQKAIEQVLQSGEIISDRRFSETGKEAR